MAAIIIVTAKTYPKIHRAFEMISNDRGTQAGHVIYKVPTDYGNHLREVDVFLGKLSDDDLMDICVGEEEGQITITGDTPEGHRTLEILVAFFQNYGLAL